MSLLDEHNDARASIECAIKTIEHIYEEADKQYSIIYSQLRELLNQDPKGAYYYMMLITSNEELKDRFYKDTGIRQLPCNYKTLMDDVTKLKRDVIEDREIMNNLQIDRLILKNCIIRFMKQHPTWKLTDNERKLIFG